MPPAASRRPDGEYRWVPGLELDVSPERLPEPPGWLVAQLDGMATGTPTLANVAAEAGGANQIPVGQRNATLARLGGAMRRVGMSQPEIAAALIQANADRCVPPLAPREVERIAFSIARYEPDQIAVALAENHWDQMYADHGDDDAVGLDDPGPIPEHLLHVPGFIDAVIDYTLSSAPYPEPVLAFCGALSLQALLAGRKVRDAADNRTNLYLLGLANSGAGKDYPRKVNQRILLEVGLAECLGALARLAANAHKAVPADADPALHAWTAKLLAQCEAAHADLLLTAPWMRAVHQFVIDSTLTDRKSVV